jgi:hypothetical protein
MDCADGFVPAGSTSEPPGGTSVRGGTRPSPAGGVVCEFTGSTSPRRQPYPPPHHSENSGIDRRRARAGRQHPHLAGPGSNSQAESDGQTVTLDANMAKGGSRHSARDATLARKADRSRKLPMWLPSRCANRRPGEIPARHWFRRSRTSWRASRRCRASSSGAAPDRSASPPTGCRD